MKVKLSWSYLILILLFSCLSIIAQELPGEDTIKVDTDLVLVNVVVTDSQGHYITNLHQKDFVLQEEKRAQAISHFAAEEAPFAAAILIDASMSMKTKLGRARLAAAQFAENMQAGDCVAVYSFNTVVEQLQDFSPQKDLSPDVWDIEARGTTRLYDALYTALDSFKQRTSERRAIILISDGGDNNSKHRQAEALESALRLGVTIYTIDIAASQPNSDDLAGSSILQEFATKTGGQYIKSIGGQQLSEKLVEIAHDLHSQYTLGFYADQKNTSHWRRLTVKVVNRNDLKVRARQGYYDSKS